MSGERFICVELEGYTMRPESGVTVAGNARTSLTVSVLDRAYCFREVARFDQPRAVSGLTRGSVSPAVRLAWVREQAERRCAELNAEHGAA